MEHLQHMAVQVNPRQSPRLEGIFSNLDCPDTTAGAYSMFIIYEVTV